MAGKKISAMKILFPLLGVGSLAWFLVRVVPKPGRAAYPCMRVAAPLASTFVLWLLGFGSSFLFLRRARTFVKQSRYFIAACCIAAGGITGGILLSTPGHPAQAAVKAAGPVGEAKGIHPGRVVWVHDSTATVWAGSGDGHWWDSTHTIQTVVDRMMSRTLQAICGKSSDAAAWDTLFRCYNAGHGRGNTGYSAGEKIAIKANLVGCGRLAGWCSVDTGTYQMYWKLDYMNVSPQIMRSLIRQLVNVVGVAQSDISIGDPSAYFPGQFFDVLHAEFPYVNYIDCKGTSGRTLAYYSAVPAYWSSRPTGVTQDYIPRHYTEAAYVINLAAMKSHAGGGITACAKNHYGSLIRLPADSGYYDLHQSLAFLTPKAGSYRAVVDLMGHSQLGGKTLLYLIDGLYAGNHNNDTLPHKWSVAPFHGDWTSSVFASQDPVALESVLFDLFQLDDDPYQYPKMAGATDYLMEAAMADNPPSGTFYDPDHATPTRRLPSLGVFEHWNNDVDRKYSRNLGTGNGIELVFIDGIASGVRRTNPVPLKEPGYFLRESTRFGVVEISIPQNGDYMFALFDSRGRKVKMLFNGPMAGGSHQVDLRQGALLNRSLAPGSYAVVLYCKDNGPIKAVASLPVTLRDR